ncbi:MAG: hypothetical protein E8D46_01365 [Nitrospira sp.]|nr:hypothetical protein [Nitrospira sp.]TKB75495.1 MAG: hypothetical protein E8D46_01365 [Nitrospira sp.]
MGSRYRQYLALLNRKMVAFMGGLLLWIGSLLLPGIGYATTIYSYVDERGTPVMTDKLENVPERYRAKVKVTEQESKGVSEQSVAGKIQQKMTDLMPSTGRKFDTFLPNISGLTHYQSRVLSIGGIVVALCLFVRPFMRSQAVRFLLLWCLIMAGVTVPALFFTSQDAALDRLTGQAGAIQDKQQKHIQGTP